PRSASTDRLHCSTASLAASIRSMVIPRCRDDSRWAGSCVRRQSAGPRSQGVRAMRTIARNRRVSATNPKGKSRARTVRCADALPTLPPMTTAGPASWDPHARTLHRVALAAAKPSGPSLFADLLREVTASLGAASGLVAVFTDETQTRVRTIASILDGRLLASFEYALAGSPCEQVTGTEFRHVASGLADEFRATSLFAAKGMDSYAAYPLCDSHGERLGLLAAMDRRRARAADDRRRPQDRRARRLERARRHRLRRAGAIARGDPARRRGVHRQAVGRAGRDEDARDAARWRARRDRPLRDLEEPVRRRARQRISRLSPPRLRALPRGDDAQLARHRGLRRLSAQRPRRRDARPRRDLVADAARPRRPDRIGDADLRGARRRRDRTAARRRDAAHVRGELSDDLRVDRGRCRRPRLGFRRARRCQPEGVRDLGISPRRRPRRAAFDLLLAPGALYRGRRAALPAARPRGTLPAVRVARAQARPLGDLVRGAAEGGVDRRRSAHPVDEPRHHRKEERRGGA